ncbi:MAG: pyridoxal phosphate enzyme (YggS family) [Bacteroidia bacterium]|jgi:pyridoxal phosphate enzyme (YggS family)
MSIASQLKSVKAELSKSVTLVAVSKTKPNESVMEAYNAGQRIFGENRIQELVSKSEELPKDIEWHMIGHLQSKKVKQIAPFISMIHSVDSAKLLGVINDQAEKNHRIIEVLLQFHVAQEEAKFGLTLPVAAVILNSVDYSAMSNIRVRGVMGMATFTDDTGLVRNEFKLIKEIFNQLKTDHFAKEPSFNQISMGMSGDYQIAIAEGSTMIRVGSTIFGERL